MGPKPVAKTNDKKAKDAKAGAKEPAKPNVGKGDGSNNKPVKDDGKVLKKDDADSK